jgi:hypothetical protein
MLNMDDDRRDDMDMVVPEMDDRLIMQVKQINLQKRIVSKFVEVTTKIVYTFEDGSTKEVIEKNNHTFI